MTYLVLVTGHTGFIGRRMVEFLEAEKDVSVRKASRTNGYDVLNPEKVNEAVRGVNIVYHFAAYVKPAESLINPMETFKVNVEGTLNILEACRRYDAALVYPSTCAIYGDSKEPITEEHPIKPPNPYAASKAAADRLCHAYYKSYGLDVKVVRLFNTYGPGQQLNKIIPTFYRQAVRGEPITVYGTGDHVRDYVFVDDIIRGLWLARYLPPGETINLATGRGTTSLEIAKLVKQILRSRAPIKLLSCPEHLGEIKFQVGSYEKARKLISWQPEVSIEEGIKRTIEWLKGIEGAQC